MSATAARIHTQKGRRRLISSTSYGGGGGGGYTIIIEGCQQVARRSARDVPNFADRPPPPTPPPAVLIVERRPQSTRTGVRGVTHCTQDAHTHIYTHTHARSRAHAKANANANAAHACTARRRTVLHAVDTRFERRTRALSVEFFLTKLQTYNHTLTLTHTHIYTAHGTRTPHDTMAAPLVCTRFSDNYELKEELGK